MTGTRPADLAAEAERYLAAIAVFRAEGCEPRWQLEPGGLSHRRRATPAGERDPLASLPRKTQ